MTAVNITFKLVEKGVYRHARTGVEIRHHVQGDGSGRYRDEWVVQERIGENYSWITTTSFFRTARAAAVAHIEKLLRK